MVTCHPYTSIRFLLSFLSGDSLKDTIFVDKVTHPVEIPIEHLASNLTNMSEKQTVAAVTVALVDLQGKIGDILKTIQSRHPSASFGAGASSGTGTGGHYSGAMNGDSGHNAVESKPLVLSAESLGKYCIQYGEFDPQTYLGQTRILTGQLILSGHP